MVKYPSVDVLSHGNGNRVKQWLYRVKQDYVSTIASLVPEPQAGLAAGITVGAKRALGSELMDAFRHTGLIHIVVLSGYNITIIIMFLLLVFGRLPRSIKYTLATLAVVLFAILTGADAPVVRASAMGLLGVAAITLGRTYDITRALVVVAVVMILWNPLILLHDIAFQLSIVATLGLIYIAPPIINYLQARFSSVPRGLLEIVGVTIAAQIAVSPLLIYYMGEVSVVAVVVNVLALPVIPLAMLMAFVTGALGMLAPTLALPFAYATHVLLTYIIWLVEFFNAVPIATIRVL
jgi:competence protein ComEC